MAIRVVRLTSHDVERFREIRLEGLRSDPNGFRYSERDDAAIATSVWATRLDQDFVVAAVDDGNDEMLGVGGFGRFSGAKLSHKGLIWGMYVRSSARGSGASNAIMEGLIAHARSEVRQLQLTVMADNDRARRFYERHGFVAYGLEPQAVRQGDDYRDELSMWLSFEVTAEHKRQRLD
ncbi:MAG: GNAT family N-acetyltransferase [Gemmatimonadaceae bacterium]|nr:GNAT family N-acetyltransferase [Gemmatimonadaceae bacterium]